MRHLQVTACLLNALLFVAPSTVGGQSTHYHVVKEINLGRSRADYIIVDSKNRPECDGVCWCMFCASKGAKTMH